MVVDVGKAGQRQREAGADAGAERTHVAIGGGVAALVLALGVDRQAVGTAPRSRRTDLRLGQRAFAVDELPGADVDPRPVERFDQGGVELAPVVTAVPGLDVDGADTGALRPGDDAWNAASLRAVDVPDPHALTVERRAARPLRAGLTGAAGRSAGRGRHVREERHKNGDREKRWAVPWDRRAAGFHIDTEHGSSRRVARREIHPPTMYLMSPVYI